MKLGAAVLGALLLLLQAGSASGATGPWILTCAVGTDAPRVFRVGRQVFQEWKPERGGFGSNLCQSFTCKSDQGRLEGVISSASLILTISVEPSGHRATWRTVGASGLSRTSGPCSIAGDKPGVHAGQLGPH